MKFYNPVIEKALRHPISKERRVFRGIVYLLESSESDEGNLSKGIRAN